MAPMSRTTSVRTRGSRTSREPVGDEGHPLSPQGETGRGRRGTLNEEMVPPSPRELDSELEDQDLEGGGLSEMDEEMTDDDGSVSHYARGPPNLEALICLSLDHCGCATRITDSTGVRVPGYCGFKWTECSRHTGPSRLSVYYTKKRWRWSCSMPFAHYFWFTCTVSVNHQ